MDATHDIPDSTDWLTTPLAKLSSVENALHCQICKEFFDTPMITSCSHTFCSKCIRTALSTDGCCPACRTQDQASKLRNNWQLQEVVATFIEARPETIKVARERQLAAQTSAQRPGKRKRINQEPDNNHHGESTGRTTRSKSRRISSQASQLEPIEVEDTDDEAFVPEEQPEEQLPADGLVECPLGCGQRMKIEEVEPHLDKCEDERIAREKAAAQVKQRPMPARPQDRLNELNYSMMKENALAKKMRDLGIPATGTKQLMMRRHTAWVNIWNANCDSSNPRHKMELLRELDAWERTQGGGAAGVPNGIMKKDFDGNGWMRNHNTDFSRLIADARRSKVKAAVRKEDKDEHPPERAVSAMVDMTEPFLSPPVGHLQYQVPAYPMPELTNSDEVSHAAPFETTAEFMQFGVANNTNDSVPERDRVVAVASQATPKKKMPMFTTPSGAVDGFP